MKPGSNSIAPASSPPLTQAIHRPPPRAGCPSCCTVGTLGRVVTYGHLDILQRAKRMRHVFQERGYRAVLGAHRIDPRRCITCLLTAPELSSMLATVVRYRKDKESSWSKHARSCWTGSSRFVSPHHYFFILPASISTNSLSRCSKRLIEPRLSASSRE